MPDAEPGIAHAVPDLIHKVLSGLRPLPIFGSGEQTRTLTHMDDIADGIVAAMVHPQGCDEDFNVSAREEMTVAEIARVVWEACGEDPDEFELDAPGDASRWTCRGAGPRSRRPASCSAGRPASASARGSSRPWSGCASTTRGSAQGAEGAAGRRRMRARRGDRAGAEHRDHSPQMSDLQTEIQAIVDRETRAWDTQDVELLLGVFHRDMVWPWPSSPDAHDPVEWVWGMGRYDEARWRPIWRELFEAHDLVHNHRETVRIDVSDQGDGAFAVVDVDTLWRRRDDGSDFHWRGRAGKVYSRVAGEWKLIAHTGLLAYPAAARASDRRPPGARRPRRVYLSPPRSPPPRPSRTPSRRAARWAGARRAPSVQAAR